jgi:nucleoside-diphosphate-sugar epimerase
MPETTPVKDTAGQVLYEKYALESKVPFVSFRPQYIYGRKSNKWDYIDWYFDRIIRNLPLPIPGDGTQKVSLTNSEDVASLLASVLTNEKVAIEQIYFNCGTDRLVTYNEVAHLCAKVARKEVNIQHYDAVALGKGTFPFRPTDFYVSPTMAMSKLGWKGSSRGLEDDLGWYYESYLARGGATKEITFQEDIFFFSNF